MFSVLEELLRIIKKKNSYSVKKKSYTFQLLNNKNLCLKKFKEEALELYNAAKYKNNKKNIVHEAADLFYHFFVLLQLKKIPIHLILKELKKRQKISGIQEKKNRKKNVRSK
jgi:phosphoribosyl-ATP pyrophosphohydrolase